MRNDNIKPARRQVNENGLTWPELVGKREMRGSAGIGLHAACWAADQGYAAVAMVPLAANGGEKRPMEKWGKLLHRTSEEIRASTLFRRRCGVSIITDVSGLVVIDLDGEDGEIWLKKLANGRKIKTRILQTHKGRHLIFRDDGVAYKNSESELAKGVDTRGKRGLELIYDPGQRERHFTDLTEPASLPDWLAAVLPRAGSRATRRAKSPGYGGDLDVRRLIREGIPPGQHDKRMTSLAMSQTRKGVFAKDGSDEEDWLLLAHGILGLSGEGLDANGDVREKFSDDKITGWYTSACAKIKAEDDATVVVESFSDVKRKTTEWIIPDYLARGEMTILDGEKASAKSFVWEDWAARLSRGDTVPWGTATGEIFRTIIFTSESSAETEIGPRLDAADANTSLIFRHVVKRRMAGKFTHDGAEYDVVHATDSAKNLEWTLPEHVDQFARAIVQAGADIAVFDPINDFFPKGTNPNGDVDVRSALAPLGAALRKANCAAILIRHMNQDSGGRAKFRGLGASAYQNRCRVHLIAAHLEKGLAAEGKYGIAIQDSNLRRVKHGVRTYNIVDSDIVADNADGYVGMVEWRSHYGSMSADDMMTRKARGIEAYALEELVQLLRPMFRQKDTWPAAEIEKAIEKAGLVPDGEQKTKAKNRLDIKSRQTKDGWIWTTAHQKFHVKRAGG